VEPTEFSFTRPALLDSDSAGPQNWENWWNWNMPQPLVPQRAVLALLGGAVVLPIALCVVLAVAALLSAMGDTTGGVALQRIALAGGILWAIDLICLILALAIQAVRDHDEPDGS
jgi:hypothetical protein